jgi:type IV secretion system protein VirB10
MPVTEIGDPRLQALFGASDPRDAGIRPAVALPRTRVPTWFLPIAALVLGVSLFLVLEARRTKPPESLDRSRQAVIEAPPPLSIPPAPAPAVIPAVPPQPPEPLPQMRTQPTIAGPAQPALSPMAYPQPRTAWSAAPFAPPAFGPPPVRVSSGSPLVIDASPAAGPAGALPPGDSPLARLGQSQGRVRASAFANRSTTVPQGYVIPAVLETGFDSTQAGFARAIVSRDVRGFDGQKVLIPRGSRLIGEYKGEVSAGQKRAVIIWTRLIRPDGMTIAMDSPAVDTSGRTGIPASVDTHFFQRLTGALLQSTFSIGAGLAGRSTGSVLVLPGANAAVPQVGQTGDIAPTLKVAPGKSISVFVAHDLDFGSGEAR